MSNKMRVSWKPENDTKDDTSLYIHPPEIEGTFPFSIRMRMMEIENYKHLIALYGTIIESLDRLSERLNEAIGDKTHA